MSPRPRTSKIATPMQSGAGSAGDTSLMESRRVMMMEEQEVEDVTSLRRKGSHKELQLEWAALLSWHRGSPAGQQLVRYVISIYMLAPAVSRVPPLATEPVTRLQVHCGDTCVGGGWPHCHSGLPNGCTQI